MMINNVKTRHILFFAMMMWSLNAFPQSENKEWMHAGNIDEIDHVRQQLIVNDFTVKLSGSTRLYSSEGQLMPISDLAVGNLVGIDYSRIPGVGYVLLELQLYSQGRKPRLNSDGE